MLLARSLSGAGFAGAFGDTDSVKALQMALAEFARVTGRSNINPNTTSGEVDNQTAIALAASMSMLTDELPKYAYYAVQAGLLLGSTSGFAKEAIERYAQVLAAAVNAASARYVNKYGSTATAPVVAPMPALVEAPWYTTPIGIGGIAVAVIVAWKIFLSK